MLLWAKERVRFAVTNVAQKPPTVAVLPQTEFGTGP